jgi:ribulose 1,5-bisphosphate carboxylase large subunit-like protein
MAARAAVEAAAAGRSLTQAARSSRELREALELWAAVSF